MWNVMGGMVERAILSIDLWGAHGGLEFRTQRLWENGHREAPLNTIKIGRHQKKDALQKKLQLESKNRANYKRQEPNTISCQMRSTQHGCQRQIIRTTVPQHSPRRATTDMTYSCSIINKGMIVIWLGVLYIIWVKTSTLCAFSSLFN